MDKLEQLLTKMHSEFAEYEAWLLQQPASVILENAFQYTTKQDILMHAESAELSPAQLETLLRLKAPLEEVFETYRNTDSDLLMIEMHDAMETCADDTMAVKRTAAVHECEKKPSVMEKLQSAETPPRAAAKAKALEL